MAAIKDENFVTTHGWMINKLNLKGNALRVYAVIYGFSQTDNNTFNGSKGYLAAWCNGSTRGVAKNIDYLLEKGYIKKIDKFIKGVKFCEYYAVELSSIVVNKVPEQEEQSSESVEQSSEKQEQSSYNNIDTIVDTIVDKIDPVFNTNKAFKKFWKRYPNKKAKPTAEKKFNTKCKDFETYKAIMFGLRKYQNSKEWKNSEFIPHPATWLNQERWNDEMEVENDKSKGYKNDYTERLRGKVKRV